MEISTLTLNAKCDKSCLTLVNNGLNSKKLLDMFYPNKKGLKRPKNISRYCLFKGTPYH
jgi:hypothetical protein